MNIGRAVGRSYISYASHFHTPTLQQPHPLHPEPRIPPLSPLTNPSHGPCCQMIPPPVLTLEAMRQLITIYSTYRLPTGYLNLTRTTVYLVTWHESTVNAPLESQLACRVYKHQLHPCRLAYMI